MAASSCSSDEMSVSDLGLVENANHKPLEHAMESAVNKVEALFQKAESDLDYMSRKLETEFSEDNINGEQINPPDLLARLHQVKKDYGAIIKETEEIKKAQLEAAQFFQTQLMTICQTMKKLEVASGHELPELSEEEQQTLQALGLPMNGSDINSDDCNESGAQVYRTLYDHFQSESSSLSVPDMTKMAMRITGTTGTAKLKVLRSLKLVNIAKDGSVKMCC
ncbi:spindle and kinetochore-associated protein 2-like [Anneissia japonica]|uniref:spindle and kinetochore-associated protein 2-like n=1 Tax=Anneissia japonica TaxID=1529436 RepID=UPI00142579D8|nr:spindle and kinetochore-associated protein 2-like [Anneissia japonica]